MGSGVTDLLGIKPQVLLVYVSRKTGVHQCAKGPSKDRGAVRVEK